MMNVVETQAEASWNTEVGAIARKRRGRPEGHVGSEILASIELEDGGLLEALPYDQSLCIGKDQVTLILEG